MAPASQAAMVWATAIAVMFGSALAIAILSAWIGYRAHKARARFLKGLWELVRDHDDQIAQAEAPLGGEHLAIVESGISRHAQTIPIKHYWTWSTTELREERLRLGSYRGQLKLQIIKDLLNEADRQ
ncbi:unnamed protein product [Prorocentrum cordatum]|uniref:Uncharacterized protein n=1 Tax=Prorocentrum cordatum TaxID=2364126 RepID=A0ABN9Y8J1_9DINO|nr:unnamed protein product [Polarella glacialis]